MTNMPAFCDNCGLIFKSPIGIADNLSNVSFQGLSVICPNCRNIARIPDGLFNSLENCIELVSGPEVTVSRLKTLSELISKLRTQNLSSLEIKNVINKSAPELQKLTDALPKTRTELYAFLALLLSVLAILISQCESGNERNININNVTNYYNETYIIKDNPTTTTPNSEKKIGRNEKCPCGSGKKFKKCHGKKP